MPANRTPIFSAQPDVSANGSTTMPTAITAAANDYTGVSANYIVAFTAGANGSYIDKIRFKPAGTNIATVARIFINNGSSAGTATNNVFFGEVSLPATTAIATAAANEIEYPMLMGINPAFRILIGLGTAVSGGWAATVVGGQY